MDTTQVKLPTHKHPLFPSARFIKGRCEGCHVNETIYGGYICNEPYCEVWFHKECAEAPLEINHPLHPQHPLLLTNEYRDGSCDFCGQKLLSPFYSCPTCQFNVDLACGIKPSPPSIGHPLSHDHPLVFLKKREEEVACEICKDSINGPSYSCIEFNVYFHLDCVHISKEVNHPCHYSHPLKFITADALTDDAEKTCLLCGDQPKKVVYHCSICNFTTCLQCTKNPPPLVIEHIKTHKHPLTLFSRRISYTCDACGMEDNKNTYICLQCDFVIHGKCIDLPRVININRHDHRISFTHHLGVGYLKCGVCRQSLSTYNGASSFSVCLNYAVHSRCAVRNDVWDGVELEDIPEDTEDIAPFKVVGDNLICYFLHEKHILKLHKDGGIHDENIRCAACIHPVGFGSIYVCTECCFVLHEKCANLPKKKRLVFGTRPYRLTEGSMKAVNCKLCGTLSDGFKYKSHGRRDVDVHCGSLSEPFVHDGHIHPLYFEEQQGHRCNGCRNNVDGHILRCSSCDFDLCLYCATLPEKVVHRNDEHPLTLCCGESTSGKHWCDICERELDPSKWFYTCFDCGVTLHTQCVLGDFSRLIPGCIILYGKEIVQVIPNNHNTRPLCNQCHSRCKVSIILKDCKKDNRYICSRSCLSSFVGRKV